MKWVGGDMFSSESFTSITNIYKLYLYLIIFYILGR